LTVWGRFTQGKLKMVIKSENKKPSKILESVASVKRGAALSESSELKRILEKMAEENHIIVRAHIKKIGAHTSGKINPASPVSPAINNVMATISQKGAYLFEKVSAIFSGYGPHIQPYISKLNKISATMPAVPPDALGLVACGFIVTGFVLDSFQKKRHLSSGSFLGKPPGRTILRGRKKASNKKLY